MTAYKERANVINKPVDTILFSISMVPLHRMRMLFQVLPCAQNIKASLRNKCSFGGLYRHFEVNLSHWSSLPSEVSVFGYNKNNNYCGVRKSSATMCQGISAI